MGLQDGFASAGALDSGLTQIPPRRADYVLPTHVSCADNSHSRARCAIWNGKIPSRGFLHHNAQTLFIWIHTY